MHSRMGIAAALLLALQLLHTLPMGVAGQQSLVSPRSPTGGFGALLAGLNIKNPLPAGLETGVMMSMLRPQPEYVPPPLPQNAYRGTYGHTTCDTDTELVIPTSTQELSDAVKALAKRAASEGRPLKVRATRQGFATIPSFTCSEQPSDPANGKPEGPKAPLKAGVMLNNMTKVLAADHKKNQLTVQAQITLKDLYEAATANNMSIPRSSLPWWQGLTIGGIMSTTSHGSGHNVTSMVCDWIVNVTFIDGKGEIHTVGKGSDELRGICGSIGLLGIVTEVTLQLTETTNTRLSTWYVRDDDNIFEDIEKMLQITPYLVVFWRPDIGKFTGHMQRPAEPGAKVFKDAKSNVIPHFTPAMAAVLGPALRSWQGDAFNSDLMYIAGRGDTISCTTAMTMAVGAPWATRPTPGTSVLGVNIPILEGVAPTNQIISTDCGDQCAWISKGMQATALDVEFAFEKEHLKNVITDIKALIAKDLKGLPGLFANTRCLMPGYYVFRFGKGCNSFTGMASGMKEPVYVQQQMLSSRNTPGLPSRYEWIQETYEQLLSCKYNARPHWGKNWDRTFTNPKCPVAPKYGKGIAALSKLQDKYDPSRVYEPELWRRMVKDEKYWLKPKCQVERSCYCEEDIHCADGFKCAPSIAFPEFKACRPKIMN